MPPDPTTYLWHIEEAATLIESFTSGKSLDDYRAAPLLRSAVERQLTIIGEALGQLSRVDKTLAEQVPDIRRIVAFRNILVHAYAQIDDELVWNVINTGIPPLRRTVRVLPDAAGE